MILGSTRASRVRFGALTETIWIPDSSETKIKKHEEESR